MSWPLPPPLMQEDLDIIFSRFGTVVDCSIIRDWKTGESLCYGGTGWRRGRWKKPVTSRHTCVLLCGWWFVGVSWQVPESGSPLTSWLPP